jgi:hypothetical protein
MTSMIAAEAETRLAATNRRKKVQLQRKILLSLIVIGALGGLTTLGVFGLFSATTQNAGNEISTGTVALSDNDSGSSLYNITGAKPGDSVTRCIKVTFNGSLLSDVHLYSTSPPGPLAQYVDLTITQGTQPGSTFSDCTGFTPDTTGTIYSGTLQNFEQTHNTHASGIDTDQVGGADWSGGDSLVFRVEATLQSGTPDTAQGSTTGSHSFIWEARNE